MAWKLVIVGAVVLATGAYAYLVLAPRLPHERPATATEDAAIATARQEIQALKQRAQAAEQQAAHWQAQAAQHQRNSARLREQVAQLETERRAMRSVQTVEEAHRELLQRGF